MDIDQLMIIIGCSIRSIDQPENNHNYDHHERITIPKY